MGKKFNFILSLVSVLVLASCGGGSDNGSSSTGGPAHRINWEAIPTQFNPNIEQTQINIGGVQRIKMDLFGFDDDVQVVYSNQLPATSGTIKIYTVFRDQASFGGLNTGGDNKNLELHRYGSYECSIQVQNGAITALKGGCFVRVQLILPVGAEIEVYNIGRLITRRFIPMETETFLTNIDHATWSEDKFKAIDEFVSSYTSMSRKPALTAEQLRTAVKEFIISDEKFKALRKLQSAVTDRENLEAMIEDQFSYFEQPQARSICGLPPKTN